MPRLQSRPFTAPDEVRTFPHGSGKVLKLDEAVIGRAVYEPGWRWTTAMPQIAGTSTCELHHLGYSVSGLMHVVMDDGQELPNARGVAVHAAARVTSFATASEVLVSWTTRDLLEGSGLTLEDAGTHELKGLDGERRLFRLLPPAT